MVYPRTLFHRIQRGIPMRSYENRSQIRALRTEVESFAEVLRLGQAADLVQRQRLRQEGPVPSAVGMPQPLVAATTTAEHTPVIK